MFICESVVARTNIHCVFYVNIKIFYVSAYGALHTLQMKCKAENAAWKIFYDKTAFIFNVFMSNGNNNNNNKTKM